MENERHKFEGVNINYSIGFEQISNARQTDTFTTDKARIYKTKKK